MKKPTKIVMSFLFILLFVSMISTAIYMSFAEKTKQQTQTADRKPANIRRNSRTNTSN